MKHIVIGGGIIGLLTAYYLRRAGEDVTVIEQGKLARESSWAGGGILSPLYPWQYPDAVNALVKYSQQLYPDLVDELRSQTGIDAEYCRCGLMMLDPEEIDAATRWAERYHIDIQILSTTAVQQHIPEISPLCIPRHSLWMPDIAQVRNPRLLKALIAALRNLGVALIEDTPVDNFVINDQQLNAVVSRDQVFTCSTATVACGAWSHHVLQPWLPDLDIEPVRGQMIMFKARPGLLNSMLMRHAQYLIPRRDGRIIMGSTVEYTGFDKSTTQDAFAQLQHNALQLVPALADFEIEQHWAGLRPGNVRHTPFICHHPTINGLFINTGHFRNGVVMAPASALLGVDQILRRSSRIDVTAFRL